MKNRHAIVVSSILPEDVISHNDWYNLLVDDCKAIITEAVFTSRWALVEGYHQLGERITTETHFNRKEIYGKKILQGLAESIGTSERTLYYAIQIYEKYPHLDTIPEGKNITWNKLITKYLPAPKPINTPSLPEGKFSVIYADPPWPVGSIVMDKWESSIEDKYPTMEIEQIMTLPVNELAADNCSLFLWTTHTFLPDALEVIKEWGFKYHCCITWNKGNGWTQFGFCRMTEFLLFAYKGNIGIDQYGKAIPTLISENKTQHSKKPDAIRDMIRYKTQEPRLEMFARDVYDGWQAWGLEI